MKKGVLLHVVCFALYVRSAPNESEMVWLKDVTTPLHTDERKLRDPNLPDNLTFQLRGGSRVLTLNLKRNYAIDPNANIYFVTKMNDGRSHLEKAQILEEEELAYYQDNINGAFVTVKCLKRSPGGCDRVINGNILIEDRNYDLHPATTKVTSRGDLFDVPDLGTRYILRDQLNVQKESSVTHEDTVTDKVKQLDKGLIQHFPNGHEQFDFSNITFLPGRGSILHNRGNGKQVYYVETAVMLDSTIWNFYSSMMMQTGNAILMPLEVARRIREVYSHIINGVSLRYSTMDDPSIEISVTLRKFFVLKTMEEFGHPDSMVEIVDGKFKVDVVKYLYHQALWTNDNDKISDHVMLFSNLGANHDGEGNAKGCRADGYFLMTPLDPAFNKTQQYTRNPWIFSTCSVEVFKDVLKSKKCLTNVGKIYNVVEWNKFTAKLPGQVYSLDQQCEIFNGHGSLVCENKTPDICHFMKCTDPVKKVCLPKHFSAFRGTDCGKNMWCKEGLCVSKTSK